MIIMCIVTVAAVMGMAPAAHAAPPSNDEPAGATPISALPFSETVDISEATVGASDACGGVATVWYQYTPTEDIRVGFDASQSSIEPVLGLYSGDPANLSLHGCSYYYYPVRIFADLTAGVTYYVSVGSSYYEPWPGATVTLSVAEAAPPLTSVSTIVNGSGTVNRDGVATVSGTVTCDQPGYAQIYVNLTQRFNRNLAQGSGYASTMCGPEPVPWSAEVWTSTGTLFGSGNATFQAFTYATDDQGSYVSADASGSMHLRRRN
jgi:hypothetical protein